VLPLLTASRALILQQSSTRRNAGEENGWKSDAENGETNDRAQGACPPSLARDFAAGGLPLRAAIDQTSRSGPQDERLGVRFSLKRAEVEASTKQAAAHPKTNV